MKIQFQGRISAIIERPVTLPDGKNRVFEYAERPPGVRLLVVASDTILVTREWRDEVKGFDIRVPGGKVFDTFAEYLRFIDDPKQLEQAARASAKRELLEETGLSIDDSDIQHLKTTECGATVVWRLHYFVVKTQHEALNPQIETDEGELIAPSWITPSALFRHCVHGDVREDRTAAVLIQWLAKSYPNLLQGGLMS
jgi:8-oxo-dGTP pyrophosphatase MutT (NUDIX family)